MARGRRASRAPARENLTWVTPREYGNTFNQGGVSQAAIPLTMSRETMSIDVGETVPIQTQLTSTSMGSQQKVRGFQGWLAIQQSDWALSSNVYAQFAVLPLPQDPDDQQAVLPPLWRLDDALYAGARKLQERILFTASQISGGRYLINWKWRGKCNLQDDEALYLFIDHFSGDAWSAITHFIKVLMVAE